ncbi:MAG: hypothetical protein FWC39_00345 [Bacteroidetes bacterium]|nr:hypothetical protein [Bacteroidota bacterium]
MSEKLEENIDSCVKCKECHEVRLAEREEQEVKRLNTIVSLFDTYSSKNVQFLEDTIYLNKDLVRMVVKSYYDDIYRFKDYSGSGRADRHKQAAYTIKWISKIKPIQIKPDKKNNKFTITANSSFALFVGFTFFDVNIARQVSEHYINNLLYFTLFRNISGRQLASTLYVLEHAVKGEQV